MAIIDISTSKRVEFIDITSKIDKVVRDEKVEEGLCVVYCPHTTAALTINENADPSVRKDIMNQLEKIVPCNGDYAHVEGNADAHIKGSLLGSSLSLLIEGRKIILGTWQGIYFCEFDGPRKRKVYVRIIKG